jgi:hypothetical protein
MLVELANHMFINTNHILTIEPDKGLWIIWFGETDGFTNGNQLPITEADKNKIVKAMRQTGGR